MLAGERILRVLLGGQKKRTEPCFSKHREFNEGKDRLSFAMTRKSVSVLFLLKINKNNKKELLHFKTLWQISSVRLHNTFETLTSR